MNAKRAIAVTLLSIIILCALGPSLVMAQEPVPCIYYGTATLNGQNVPDGVEITAWIGDLRWVAQRWLDGNQTWYGIEIPADQTTPQKDGGARGDVITFKIGDALAHQTATWFEGTEAYDMVLHLTAGGSPPTATPTRRVKTSYLPLLVKGPTATPTPRPTSTPTYTLTATTMAAYTPTRTFTPQPAATPTVPSWAQTTVTIASGKDAYIYSYAPTNNYGTAGELHLKTDNTRRALIHFDLSAIPPHAIIDSAQMTIYTNWYRGGGDWSMDMQAYMLRRHWEEQEVTWNAATKSQRWGAPGASDPLSDHDPTVVGSFSVRRLETAYLLDITSAVRLWLADPSANHGLLLVGTGNIVEYRFWSLNYLDPALRPKLVVLYRMPSL